MPWACAGRAARTPQAERLVQTSLVQSAAVPLENASLDCGDDVRIDVIARNEAHRYAWRICGGRQRLLQRRRRAHAQGYRDGARRCGWL